MTTSVATVQLTQASILAMYENPVLVFHAPGFTLSYIVDSFTLNYAFGTAPYTGGGDIALQFGPTPHSGAGVITNSIASNIFTASSNTLGVAAGAGISTAAMQPYINTPIYISNSSAPFISGNGTATLVIYYQLVQVV